MNRKFCSLIFVAGLTAPAAFADETIDLDQQPNLSADEIRASLFPHDDTGCDPIEAAKAKMTCMGFMPTPKVFSLPSKIVFKLGSAELSEEAKRYLNKFGPTVSVLEGTDLKVLITGHTDATGPHALNERLSQQRAESVKTYFVRNFGAPSANLLTVGVASSRLKRPDQPAAAENRRVEIGRK